MKRLFLIILSAVLLTPFQALAIPDCAGDFNIMVQSAENFRNVMRATLLEDLDPDTKDWLEEMARNLNSDSWGSAQSNVDKWVAYAKQYDA